MKKPRLQGSIRQNDFHLTCYLNINIALHATSKRIFPPDGENREEMDGKVLVHISWRKSKGGEGLS